MKKTTQISSEDFESLMNWFSVDSEEAGIEYENIRLGLVRYFRFRGCTDSQNLADETINRVAKKLNKLDFSKNPKPSSIFYGFATNVYKEYVREYSKKEFQLITEFPFEAKNGNGNSENNQSDKELDCLDSCLNRLPTEDRKLITLYFSGEKAEKIAIRKKISEDLGITPNALHVRIYRMKQELKKCIKKCIKKKDL